MRNMFRKFVSALAGVLILAMSLSFTSRAEFAEHSDYYEDFYLTAYELYIEQGSYDTVGVHATNYVSYFIVGAHSKDTYVVLKGAGAGFDLEVHVGRDETASMFTYIWMEHPTIIKIYMLVSKKYIPIIPIQRWIHLHWLQHFRFRM